MHLYGNARSSIFSTPCIYRYFNVMGNLLFHSGIWAPELGTKQVLDVDVNVYLMGDCTGA
jgi:hypothetical protein